MRRRNVVLLPGTEDLKTKEFARKGKTAPAKATAAASCAALAGFSSNAFKISFLWNAENPFCEPIESTSCRGCARNDFEMENYLDVRV